jgi:hypothetical protein
MTTLESMNTKVIANLLIFPLVHHMASSDTQFSSYGFSKSDGGAERFWTDWQLELNLRFGIQDG